MPSSWGTAFDVWEDKQIIRRMAEEGNTAGILRLEGAGDPDAARRKELGHAVEDLIAQRWAAREGVTVLPVDATWAHDSEPWATATLDRLVLTEPYGTYQEAVPDRAAEVKNVGVGIDGRGVLHHWKGEEDGEVVVPEYVALGQVQWQGGIARSKGFDWDRITVVAMLGGRVEVGIDVFLDDRVFQALLTIAGDFYDKYIRTGQPPPLVNDRATDYIRRKFPRATVDLVKLPEANDIVFDIAATRAQMETLKQANVYQRNQLMDMMGPAEKAVGRWGSATWRAPASRAVVDKDALLEDLFLRLQAEAPGKYDRGELIASHTTFTTPERELRVYPAPLLLMKGR